jgi:MYXO-CTERM domain-containing protein
MKRTWTQVGPKSLALLGAAAALLPGCSAPGNDSLDTNLEALTTPFANDKPAYDYFVGKGLTNFQAAAVVGNLDQESGVNPTISQSGGGPGRGIAQWSAGARWDTTPGDNLVAYAAMQGMPTSSLTVQLGFIWYELQTFPQYGLAMLRATTNITDATMVFEDDFEGCVYANFPVCNLPQRVTYAKNVLAAYGSDPALPDGGAGDGGATMDAKTNGDGATGADGRTIGDGAPTPDRIADDGAATSDAATSDAAMSLPGPDAAPPQTHDAEGHDAGAPDKTSDSATSDPGQGASTPASVDSSGCSMPSRGAEGSSRGWWLVAIGVVLASARRRRPQR